MPNDLIDQLTQDYRYAKEEVRWVESTEEKTIGKDISLP